MRSRRQQLHGRIAQVLEDRFAEIVEIEPEVLAHHYSEAGLPELALPHWDRAARRAIERSANAEAIGHLNKALGLIQLLPQTPDTAQQELQLHLLLGPVLMFVKGVAAPEVGSTYARACELCQQGGETSQKFAALWGSWYFHSGCGDHLTARVAAEELVSLGRENQDTAMTLMAHRALCNTLHHIGDLAATHEQMKRVIELYDPQRHRSLALQYGQDPSVTARAWGGLALWQLGYPDQALTRLAEARRTAVEISHPPSIAYALGWAALLHRYRREYNAALEMAEAVIALSAEQGFALYAAWGTTVKGWALSNMGQAALGCELVRKGVSELRATGLKGAMPQQLAVLAESYALAGRLAEALATVDEALTLVEVMSERNYEAELHRLKGELLQQISIGSADAAEACFQKALDAARRQGAKLFELRAATSLVRLRRSFDNNDAGHDLLAPIQGWFTEGFDTADLKDAKALLDELGMNA